MSNNELRFLEEPSDLTSKQKELLEAALRVMSKKGYSGSRTRDIAHEAGVSEATLFKHFPTKRHILIAIMEPFLISAIKPIMMKSLEQVLAAHKGKPLGETLRAIALDRIALVRARTPLITTIFTEAVHQPEVLEIVRTRVVPIMTSVLGDIYDAALERGEIRGIDKRLFIRGYVSLLAGYVILGWTFPEALGASDDASGVDGVIDLMLHGVERREEQP